VVAALTKQLPGPPVALNIAVLQNDLKLFKNLEFPNFLASRSTKRAKKRPQYLNIQLPKITKSKVACSFKNLYRETYTYLGNLVIVN
jgi:hypothetical protein